MAGRGPSSAPPMTLVDFTIFTEPQQGATYGDLLAVAQRAERLGFGAFFRSDHYLAMGDGDGMPGPTDAWITLAGLARETSTIRLGTLVSSATFRLPGPLAISVAQVDQMSGGRVELGLGAGWYAEEHVAYGLPFLELGERFDRLEEQLDVITGLWSTPIGERFDHPGPHYRIVGSPALPKPTQARIPIVIGGGGRKRTPALAARHATEFNARSSRSTSSSRSAVGSGRRVSRSTVTRVSSRTRQRWSRVSGETRPSSHSALTRSVVSRANSVRTAPPGPSTSSERR